MLDLNVLVWEAIHPPSAKLEPASIQGVTTLSNLLTLNHSKPFRRDMTPLQTQNPNSSEPTWAPFLLPWIPSTARLAPENVGHPKGVPSPLRDHTLHTSPPPLNSKYETH